MAKISKRLKKWRKRQKPGAIMKPGTFESIKRTARRAGLSKERAEKIAGAAYWQAAKKKFKKRRKKK